MHVLVVEDEQRLAEAIAQGLSEHGFAVDLAHDGMDGYIEARHGEYDAIVLDIMLPRLSGYDVCKRLRADQVWTPILMLTAKDGEYDEADALDLGADDYLRKPFAMVVLVARLHALLRRGAPERPVELRVRDLVLDPGARSVRRGGTSIDLTPREFSLLEYLVRNAGQSLSKHTLMEHVWGADWDRDANVVEVYIAYLRRKVDRPFPTALIETVRGHGYRLSTTDD